MRQKSLARDTATKLVAGSSAIHATVIVRLDFRNGLPPLIFAIDCAGMAADATDICKK